MSIYNMSSEAVMRPDIVNYKTYPMHNGRYRFRTVALNNQAGAEIKLEQTATKLAEFKLPANQVWNLGRSSFDYTIETPLVAAKSIWSFEDTMEVCSSIQLCNASGVYLADLQYANNYLSVARKIDMSKEDFESSDFGSGLYKAPQASLTTNYFPPGVTMPASNAYNQAAAPAITALTSHDPQYAKASVKGAAGLTARSIPLSAFTRTAIGMDRDVIFGEDMYIRIMLAPSKKVCYTATEANDPVTGSAVIGPGLNETPVVRNLVLKLAVQTDEVVVASIREKFNAGNMSYLIPFQYGWKNSSSNVALASNSFQIQLTNQFGNRLKRMLHFAMPQTEEKEKAYDHQNLNGAKIESYQTFLDSIPLQDSVVSCMQPVIGGPRGMDDFRENRDLLRGSALENSLVYYYNWHHQDSFSQPKRGKVLVPEENILEGLDLTFPRQWTIQVNSKTPLSHYTFGEFVRQVVATPVGTTILVA